MPDRFLDSESSCDSRASRTGPMDSCDIRANNPAINWLMLAATIVVVILAGTV